MPCQPPSRPPTRRWSLQAQTLRSNIWPDSWPPRSLQQVSDQVGIRQGCMSTDCSLTRVTYLVFFYCQKCHCVQLWQLHGFLCRSMNDNLAFSSQLLVDCHVVADCTRLSIMVCVPGVEQLKAREEDPGKEGGSGEGTSEDVAATKNVFIQRKVPVGPSQGQPISVLGVFSGNTAPQSDEIPQTKRLPEPIVPSAQTK